MEKEIKYVLGEMDELIHHDHLHLHCSFERVHLLYSSVKYWLNPNLPCNMSLIMVLLASQHISGEVEDKLLEAMKNGKIELCNEITLKYLLLLPKLKI